MGQNRKKHRQNSRPIINCPTSEGVSKVSEWVNKWVQRRAWAKRAVRSKRMSARCERMSGRTSKWPISVLFYFWPLCDRSKLRRKRRAGKPMTKQELDRSFERMRWAWRGRWDMDGEILGSWALKTGFSGWLLLWRAKAAIWSWFRIATYSVLESLLDVIWGRILLKKRRSWVKTQL